MPQPPCQPTLIPMLMPVPAIAVPMAVPMPLPVLRSVIMHMPAAGVIVGMRGLVPGVVPVLMVVGMGWLIAAGVGGRVGMRRRCRGGGLGAVAVVAAHGASLVILARNTAQANLCDGAAGDFQDLGGEAWSFHDIARRGGDAVEFVEDQPGNRGVVGIAEAVDVDV